MVVSSRSPRDRTEQETRTSRPDSRCWGTFGCPEGEVGGSLAAAISMREARRAIVPGRHLTGFPSASAREDVNEAARRAGELSG